MPLIRALPSAVVLVAVTTFSAAAPADEPTKQACIDANESAQLLQQSGKYTEARKQLAVCVSDSCPTMIRADCAERVAALDKLQPTIIFDGKDAAGHDLVDVKVTLDGQTFATRLDGRALPVDPGAHAFTFQVGDQPQVAQTFVINEAQKDRREVVVVTTAPGPAPVLAPPSSASVPPAHESAGASTGVSSGSVQRITGVAVGAAGVVGLGLGVAFGLAASSKWSSAQNECRSPSNCNNYPRSVSDHDGASSDAMVSTVGFVVGAALAATGAALYFLAPKGGASGATALRVSPTVGPQGAGLLMRAGF
jgi:hypothetical protein